MSRCWSILHSAYMVRTALMASLCAGPVPPLRASSRLRQIQVARLRRFPSGVPNQYLPASQPLLDSPAGREIWEGGGGVRETAGGGRQEGTGRDILEEAAAGCGLGMCRLVEVAEVAVVDALFVS